MAFQAASAPLRLPPIVAAGAPRRAPLTAEPAWTCQQHDRGLLPLARPQERPHAAQCHSWYGGGKKLSRCMDSAEPACLKERQGQARAFRKILAAWRFAASWPQSAENVQYKKTTLQQFLISTSMRSANPISFYANIVFATPEPWAKPCTLKPRERLRVASQRAEATHVLI